MVQELRMILLLIFQETKEMRLGLRFNSLWYIAVRTFFKITAGEKRGVILS